MEAYTVGVEEEYQLVDPATGALVSRARDVLSMDWAGEAEHEVQETQVEISTRICGSAAELEREIRRLRFHVGAAAAAADLVPVAAGLHPFSEWREQEHTAAARYRRLIHHYGLVIESEHVFGMHVHVAVPPEVDRMRAIRALRPYLPHLLALSASSPFLEGRDTRYASYRTILNDRLPCSGPPPPFASEAEYWAFTAGLIEQGVAVDEGTTYWTVRPHHRYPTIEIRCADVCPRVGDALVVAALARALVAAAGEGVLDPPASFEGSEAALAGDQWQAARRGLAGRARRADGTLEPFSESLLRLRDRLAPVAEGLGDAWALENVESATAAGNAATRMREIARETRGLKAVVDWLAAETVLGTGMDRRRFQRPAERDGASLRGG